MGEDRREDQKRELLDLMAKAPAEVDRAGEVLKKLQSDMHFVADIAPAAREYFEDVPADAQTQEQWAHQISGWQALLEPIGRIEASIVLSSVAATGYATTSATNTSIYVVGSSGITLTPQMQAAEATINRILHRAPLLEEVRSSMRRLGLDQGVPGERSALDILEAAQAGLGTGNPSALVTMRDTIWAVLGHLNRRKPSQEAGAGMDMVTSIGRQCGWPYLDRGYFERLAIDGKAQIDQLSGGKHKDIPAKRVGELFDRALVFLNAFLHGIDNTRLRP